MGHFHTRFLGSPPKGAKGSKQGAKGSKGSEQGAKGSKGSEGISILGFRVPNTCGGKNFDDHI